MLLKKHVIFSDSVYDNGKKSKKDTSTRFMSHIDRCGSLRPNIKTHRYNSNIIFFSLYPCTHYFHSSKQRATRIKGHFIFYLNSRHMQKKAHFISRTSLSIARTKSHLIFFIDHSHSLLPFLFMGMTRIKALVAMLPVSLSS